MGPSPSAVRPGVPRDRRSARVHQQRRGYRLPSRLPIVMMIAALVGGAGVLMFASTPRSDARGTIAPQRLIDRLDELAAYLGLGLDQVEVSGHRFTNDADILDAVDLRNVRSFLRFDSAAIRTRVERLAWVDTATIERLLPNRVGIRITERRPFAVWERGQRDVLIDATGRQLATVARNSAPDLPRVAGELAPEDAPRLLDLVAAYPEIAQKLARAERVSRRRWRLIMHDQTRVELPVEADAAALAMLVEARPGGRLIDVAATVIDMTVLRRITIRPSAPQKPA